MYEVEDSLREQRDRLYAAALNALECWPEDRPDIAITNALREAIENVDSVVVIPVSIEEQITACIQQKGESQEQKLKLPVSIIGNRVYHHNVLCHDCFVGHDWKIYLCEIHLGEHVERLVENRRKQKNS
jgi:hypothetical protein